MDPKAFLSDPDSNVRDNAYPCQLSPFPLFLDKVFFQLFSKFPTDDSLANELDIVTFT